MAKIHLAYQPLTNIAPIYGLTEGGWAVLNRSHAWVLATFAVSFASLIASLFGVWVNVDSEVAARA
jgi:hypothetical protein